MIEARCAKCGETYNPDADDLEHGCRDDGTECGGFPIEGSLGAWGSSAADVRRQLDELEAAIARHPSRPHE